jgi:hypothetical protein
LNVYKQSADCKTAVESKADLQSTRSELSPIKRTRAGAKNDLLEGNFPRR